jgi:hypothetical protein
MRTQLLGVLIYGFLLGVASDAAWAARTDTPHAQVHTISSSHTKASELQQALLERQNEKSTPVSTFSRGKKSSLSVKDLVLSKPHNSKQKSSDTVSVEPWVPGRGSLGVQLQVTW